MSITRAKAPAQLKSLKLTLAALLAMPASGALAMEAFDIEGGCPKDKAVRVDIPAQTMENSLNALAQQSGFQVVFYSKDAKHISAKSIAGEFENCFAAISTLLKGTGLGYYVIDKQTISIRPLENSQAYDYEKSILLATNDHFDLGTTNRSEVQQAQRDYEKRKFEIEEIIVTATKRSQSLQNTAMSISAISGSDISKRSLIGMNDYLRTLPGISMIDLGAGRNSVIIRGISAEPELEGRVLGQTVGIYLSDVPLTGYAVDGGSADIKLVDIERIEVLRGPQGTLYGSSSLGGTVRNIPRSPNLQKLEGKIKVSYSTTAKSGGNNNTIRGVINLPIVESQLAVRVVGYRFANSGYVENVAGSNETFAATAATFGVEKLAVDQDDVGNENYNGGRITALWKPTEKLNATLMYLSQDLDQDGFPEVQLQPGLGDYQQTRLKLNNLVGGGSERLIDKIEITNLVFQYDFGWADLLSSTSWTDQETLHARDIGSFFGGLPLPQRREGQADALIEELRLTSQLGGNLQYLVGFYYQDVNKKEAFPTYFGGDPDLNPFEVIQILDQVDDTNIKQKAMFGELSYTPTEQVEVTVGARRFTYDRSIDQKIFGTLNTPLENDESDATYKVSAAYAPSIDSLFYAQWSEGFRLGRPLEPAPQSLCDIDSNNIIDSTTIPTSGLSLKSDTIESFEIGSKLTLLDGRLTLNSALFRNEWTGFPITTVLACGYSFIQNAGEARTQGVELESEWALRDELRLTIGASYIDAELTENAEGLGSKGDRLPGSPKYNFSAGLQYNFEIAGKNSFIRGDYAFVGGFYNNLQESGVEAGNYSQLNVRAGTTFNNLAIDFFGTNLTNAEDLTWVGAVFSGADERAYRLRPRTLGINIEYQF